MGSPNGRGLDERTEIILAATFLVLIILAFIRSVSDYIANIVVSDISSHLVHNNIVYLQIPKSYYAFKRRLAFPVPALESRKYFAN